MEKKVSYLMLLLCIFLFPFRVRGLEEVEVVDKEEIVENVLNEEIVNDLEDLVEIEDLEEVLIEETSNEETDLEELEEENEQDEIDTTEPEDGENNESENNPDNNEEEPVVENVVLNEFNLTGVNTELVADEDITFGGSSLEEDKYSVVREEWVYYDEVTTYHTSDSSYNESLASSGNYFQYPVGDLSYGYRVVLQLKDGYSIGEEPTVNINGENYYSYVDNYDEELNIVILELDLIAQAKNNESLYVDSLELINVNSDAYVGQSPLYGASSNTEHFNVVGEVWSYYTLEEVEDGYEYYFYVNASNSSLIDESDIIFDKFEKDNTYTYIIEVDALDGYRLSYTSGNTLKYKIIINGEEKDCEVYGYDNNGTYRYRILVAEVTPTEAETYEVTENSDVTITEGEASDTSITINSIEEDSIEAVYVDGNLISREEYTTEGNTILTLLASILNTLGQGVHDISMKFLSGVMAYSTITVDSGQTTEEVAATPMSQINNSEVTATYLSEVIEEKEEDHELEVKEKEEEIDEEEVKEESNLGLIIFLILLILIAIIIPVTIYRKNN